MSEYIKSGFLSSDGTQKGNLLQSNKQEQEIMLENKLRPSNFEDYVGQEKTKDNLKIYIEASKKRGEPLDHLLLYGPPGLGKTTLSYIIANEMGANIKLTSGPAISRSADMASVLSNLNEGDVLFIDEIHRLNKSIEEILYSAMEDFVLDLVIGKGPSARSMRLNLAPFTLIGATTKVGNLSNPLRDRFGVVERLEFYSENELMQIIKRSAKILDVKITDEACKILSKRSRQTPRIANRLLKRIRDFAELMNNGVIDEKLVNLALNRLQVDDMGLDSGDIFYMSVLKEKFNGGPVGVETLATAMSEDTSTLEDVIEPFLMQIGFVARTIRGRVLTDLGINHLQKIKG